MNTASANTPSSRVTVSAYTNQGHTCGCRHDDGLTDLVHRAAGLKAGAARPQANWQNAR